MPVVAVNCLELSEEEIKNILQKVLYQFPVKEIKVDMPQWLCSLEKEHWLRSAVFTSIKQSASHICRVGQVGDIHTQVMSCDEADWNNIWKSYLDMDTDYAGIAKRISL